MKILNLKQGSDEWLKARLNYLCASEAPAIMGDSKFMSRNQLLDLKKGWISNPISSFKEKLFEKGHVHEAQAREIIELETCEALPPVVGLRKIDGVAIEFLSSFDGCTYEYLWEHKDWNTTLAENVRNSVIEPLYYWQLEHQMITAGHNEIVFMCSDGTTENRVSLVYKSVPERREQLIAGSKQFLIDLEKHEIKAKQEAVVAMQTQLPVITYQVSGTEISTNISNCLEKVKELAHQEMSKVLETDQDFADKDQLNKDVKKARSRLKELIGNVRGKFVSYSDFEDVAKDMDSVLQKMQSQGEKQVKQDKEAKKLAIEEVAEKEIMEFSKKCSLALSPMTINSVSDLTMPDFYFVMKGKRTIESLENAVSVLVSKTKVEIKQVMDRVIPNLQYLKDNAEAYKFLFNDIEQLVNQEAEPFQAIVKSRIADHKQTEEKRLEQERERIRIEEQAKAQREADAKAEAARERIRKEEQAKAQAKQLEEQKQRDTKADLEKMIGKLADGALSEPNDFPDEIKTQSRTQTHDIPALPSSSPDNEAVESKPSQEIDWDGILKIVFTALHGQPIDVDASLHFNDGGLKYIKFKQGKDINSVLELLELAER